MSLLAPLLLIVTFAAAVGLTAVLRAYAHRSRLLDVPNARSSHVVATPRGGGLAIVIATLAAFAVLLVTARLSRDAFVAIAGAGTLVAAIGFADDRRGVAARWRLAGHFVAAAWLLFWIGGPPPLVVFGRSVEWGIAGYAAAALFVVWILNLTNFMDGIDGIAAVEAVTVPTAAAALYVMGDSASGAGAAALIVAAAALGFLVWNWPPASIFMGDAGSGFLGLVFAFLSLQAGWIDARLFWCWLILLGVFVADATVTLARRVWRRQRVYEAHRSHAYQHAARQLGGHLPVTLATAVVNIGLLFPIAVLVASGRLEPILGIVVAYVPLTAAALWLGAGEDAH